MQHPPRGEERRLQVGSRRRVEHLVAAAFVHNQGRAQVDHHIGKLGGRRASSHTTALRQDRGRRCARGPHRRALARRQGRRVGGRARAAPALPAPRSAATGCRCPGCGRARVVRALQADETERELDHCLRGHLEGAEARALDSDGVGGGHGVSAGSQAGTSARCSPSRCRQPARWSRRPIPWPDRRPACSTEPWQR
jgi:hypothetical protein